MLLLWWRCQRLRGALECALPFLYGNRGKMLQEQQESNGADRFSAAAAAAAAGIAEAAMIVV